MFGGDGASFAVPAAAAGLAREALAATATWVKEDLDLTLRIAMVSVAEIRSRGLDVRVARYAPSENISIAMFSGGGMAWADAAMKRGEIAVAPRRPARTPISPACRAATRKSPRRAAWCCRWSPRRARREPGAFRTAVEAIAGIVEKTPDASRPVPGQRLRFTWPPQGADLEAR